MGNQCGCLGQNKRDTSEVEVPQRESEEQISSDKRDDIDTKRFVNNTIQTNDENSVPLTINAKLSLLKYKQAKDEPISKKEHVEEEAKKMIRGSNVSQNKIDSLTKSPIPSRCQSIKSIRKSPQITADLKNIRTKKLEEPYEPSFLFLGESGVGKTSIIYKICYNQFDSYHIPSINAERINYNTKHANFNYSVNFIDTCGLPEYKSELDELTLNSDFLVYIVDLTDTRSFTYIKDLILSECGSQMSRSKTYLQQIILGNKFDMAARNKELKAAVKEFADNQHISYIEVSAKNNLNLVKFLNQCLEVYYCQRVTKQTK